MTDGGDVGTVWASTWVPGKFPLGDTGEAGYGVAWVDVDGRRVQHLVRGDAPAPGTTGTCRLEDLGGSTVPVFEAGGGES